MKEILTVIIFGLTIGLVHVNGDCHIGECTPTYTTTSTTTIQTQGCNNCKGIEHKLQQIDAKLDRLMARVNITNPYSPSPFLHSCEEINTNWPDSPSGYYIIADTNGHPRHVYCHMESLCNSSGGWMRVAYLNMSDPTEECPPGFRLYNRNGIRPCGRPAADCQSVKFPSNNISYSQVCGRVIGYQYGSPDAIHSYGGYDNNDINGAYVDGVSITHGNPRQHVWTFMAALREDTFENDGRYECPCAPNSTVTVPSFIGNDYFCESGCPGNWQINVLYTDPLWDGKQCGLIEKDCCLAPGLPWFHKTLNSSTTDYIELRVCSDQTQSNEDSPVGYYEIYVK